MWIKAKDKDKIIYINFDKVSQIECYEDKDIRFVFTFQDDIEDIKFNSCEERDKAMEKIIDDYRWERKVCDLSQEDEKHCKVCNLRIKGELDVCTGCY